MFYETNLDMNSQDFKPSYSALQIDDEQLTPVHCVLLGVAVVIFIAVLVLYSCCCNKSRALHVEANLENNDISAVETKDLEATPSCKWEENHQECVKVFENNCQCNLYYNGMLVPVRTSFNLRRCREKTYNVST